ncbi:hypothetical protein COW36_01390 [bacterium (Candidatus Blackallbacteria) CG17_big_fil_post_rev_8_21_14_2_50_48_46]|uniref:Uncharacterized protein n=1 Tax=bacterium (Candidatus Blackallbacteria) CG17_big_fil_post_rev_8_21_14_2_50_48_46 TaxID=2014261 RepID=A0A2M7GBF1_9BACT|nr:MAG: hypothetical protein COW64_09785 [bacterium (Candidatus Blackallbacteria) CG18_big_fil_WC_8_21_14_2_50_49_26]PIW19521.1 MAG: hypothetical protein COW36_01390 [bacterium (Candidatus Blackallbacteria) CG17_big_fil_post_rev_8_21_14_2_50_48_46]PIW48875.1 MAG: hypothetical protein COW20_07065 [bacterium (Candidatus Blackallbacteria) CG13_big_fil_rev_8_21_14_2_50_49_14]
MSQYLNKTQLKGLVRLGRLMLPHSGEFPSFQELGCIEHIDEIAAYIPETDLADLKMLLTLLALMPTPGLKGLIRMMQSPDAWPESVASTLRQMDTGLRGIIMSLYYSGRKGSRYSGQTPLELMGVEIVRVPL